MRSAWWRQRPSWASRRADEIYGDSLDGFDADLDADADRRLLRRSRPARASGSAARQARPRGSSTTSTVSATRAHPGDRRSGSRRSPPRSRARRTSSDLQPRTADSRSSSASRYSDGFGREIQKKIQAEPGPRCDPTVGSGESIPRWVGSGWTIFNNKGKPVRQYEPFFTDTHRFEFGVQRRRQPDPVLRPVERVVATLHPNHTYEKVVFDPWQQTTWDVNDTVLVSIRRPIRTSATSSAGCPTPTTCPPGTTCGDPHARRQRWPDASRTRDDARPRPPSMRNTPTIAHLDTLGRTFLTVAHNRFERNGADRGEVRRPASSSTSKATSARSSTPAGPHRHALRLRHARQPHPSGQHGGGRALDAERRGRQADPRLGQPRITSSARPTIALRRPTRCRPARRRTAPELLVERTVYGESQPDAEAQQPARQGRSSVFDQAGVVTSEAYDFKGNLLRSQRQLAHDYKDDARLVGQSASLDARDIYQQHDLRRAQPADQR